MNCWTTCDETITLHVCYKPIRWGVFGTVHGRWWLHAFFKTPYWKWRRSTCFPELKWQSTWQTEAKWKIASFFFLPILYFLSLALFSPCIAVFLFLSTFCLSSHPFPLHRLPSSILLPLTLLSFCLTAVGLRWEVIRKNSTETHTAAAENKSFNTFYSPSLHYNSKRLRVRGRGGWGRVCRNYQNIFREWWGRKCCFGKPKL